MRRGLFLLGSGLLCAMLATVGRTQNAERNPNYPPPPYGTFFSIHPPHASTAPPVHADLTPPKPLSDKELEKMIEVPAGFFLMGADDGFADERPQRRVYVKRFLIDKYEVTNKRFLAAGMRPARSFGSAYDMPGLPVVGVSWNQARQYCDRVGKRLPTEAEWEKAARGADGRFFPWGNFWDPALANDGRGPKPVGSYPGGASPYGAHDMAGNVWEWVFDPYDRANDKPSAQATERRVLRGGSWNYAAVFLRTSYRRHERPDFVEHRIGFRCVKDAP